MKSFILSSLFIVFMTACTTQKMENGPLANLKWHQVEARERATPRVGIIDLFPRTTGVNLRTGAVKWQVSTQAPSQEPTPLRAEDFLPHPFPELLPPNDT